MSGPRPLQTPFVAAALLILLCGALVVAQRRHEEALAERDASSLLRLQVEVVAREFAAVGSDLALLAGDPRTLAAAQGDAAAKAELDQALVRFSAARGTYHQVRILDADGGERVRVNLDDQGPRAVGAAELQAKGDRDYVAGALALSPGQVFVSRFDLNVEHGRVEEPARPTVRFAAPIVDTTGRTQGAVVLNQGAARLLEELGSVARADALDFQLVDHQGFWIQAPPGHQPWGFALPHADRLTQADPSLWSAIDAQPQGSRLDRTGLWRWQRWSPSGDSTPGPLHFVASIPRSALRARSRRLLVSLAVLLAVALPLLGASTASSARADGERDRAALQLAESEGRLRLLTLRLLEGQERERQRLCRDLHDDLGQISTALRIDSETARRAPDEERRAAALARVADNAEVLLEHIHRIAADLRPALLDDLGLADALRRHCADVQERSGVEVTLRLSLPPAPLPSEAVDHGWRILQEALGNVVRHAQARRVEVELGREDRGLRIVVADDGRGFDPSSVPPSSLGLLGMRERAELLGGTFSLRSAPDQGTRIEVCIPLPPTGA